LFESSLSFRLKKSVLQLTPSPNKLSLHSIRKAVDDYEMDASEPPKYEGTIFAQSTPVGMGGVAIVRVSGPDAPASLMALSLSNSKLPKPRYASLRSLVDPVTKESLDKSLVLYFPRPNSFTGEDVVEYHLHGGVAVVNSVLDALSKVPGLRLAERGEFTKRAYLNGQMDLLEAEALNDLIHAETSGQQKQAMKQISGAHRTLYQKWRTAIVRNLAHINAYIDYGDSDGLIEGEVLDPVREEASATLAEIQSHLADGRRGEAIRNGLHCTLVGPPNAGKSSLLNLLASRPAAIVSSTPGTTRDIVQVRLQLGGFPVTVDDTAGIRESTQDEIEKEGMKRSAASFRQADIRILVLDGSNISESDCESVVGLLSTIDSGDNSLQALFDSGKNAVGNWEWSRRGAGPSSAAGDDDDEEEERDERERPLLVALNKVDLCQSAAQTPEERQAVAGRLVPLLQRSLSCPRTSLHWVSCTSREGLEGLVGELEAWVQGLMSSKDDAPLITRARHRELLLRCAKALQRFIASEHPVDIQAGPPVALPAP
jgi:tRNA modification GTPase